MTWHARVPGRQAQRPLETSVRDDPSLDRDAQTVSLGIVEREGAVFLLGYDAAGRVMFDSWHPTLAGAMAEAQSQFGVLSGAWVQDTRD